MSNEFKCPKGHTFQANAQHRAHCPRCGQLAQREYDGKEADSDPETRVDAGGKGSTETKAEAEDTEPTAEQDGEESAEDDPEADEEGDDPEDDNSDEAEDDPDAGEDGKPKSDAKEARRGQTRIIKVTQAVRQKTPETNGVVSKAKVPKQKAPAVTTKVRTNSRLQRPDVEQAAETFGKRVVKRYRIF